MEKLLESMEKQAVYQRLPRGWPLFVFALVALATAVSVIAIERTDAQRRALELDRNSTEIASALQQRVTENTAILRAAAALFGKGERVSRAEFESFAKEVHDGGNLAGSLGLGWARLVPTSRLAQFEQETRATFRGDFKVTPRPEPGRTVMVPIVHIVPETQSNSSAVGFDMYSEPTRREAIDRAIREDIPIASGKVALVQSRGQTNPAGFLIYMPVRGGDGVSVEGMIYAPFDADRLLASASELSRTRAIEVELFDSETGVDNLLAMRRLPGDNGKSLLRRIKVGGRTWIVSVAQKKQFWLSPIAMLTLLFGAIASLLVLAIGILIMRRAEANRRVVEVLTSQAAIRDSLTRELNHRVKNTLANVLSIAALTRSRSTDIDEFTESLTSRIRALSATHDLLSQSDWRDAALGDVIRSELAPYMKEGEVHARLEGPEIRLAPNDAMSLGLAIHELATNAAKYGALSVTDGLIHVTWTQPGPEIAEIHWREEGGPPVRQPEKRGFGRDLIEKIVAHELRSEVDLQFRPAGVECRLKVPVRRAGEFALRSERAAR